MPRTRLAIVLTVIAMGIATTASSAVIDFNIAGGPILPVLPAEINYLGGTTPLFGTGIAIDTVTASGTPDNAGSFDCIDCALSFATGNFLGAGPNTWLFASTGPGVHVSVTGGIDTDGDTNADIPLLMLGNFVGPQISVDVVDIGPAFSLGVTAGIFLDVKNTAFTSFFGLPTFPYVGGLVVGWGGLAEPPGPIFANSTGGVVRNTFVAEPGTLLLLWAGMAGFAAARRRRSVF